MFAILFGLSTDYQVFLLTQIQEHFKEGKSARATVIEGLGYSGRIIGAAALAVQRVRQLRPKRRPNDQATASAWPPRSRSTRSVCPSCPSTRSPAAYDLAAPLVDRILPHISIEGAGYFAEEPRPAPLRHPSRNRSVKKLHTSNRRLLARTNPSSADPWETDAWWDGPDRSVGAVQAAHPRPLNANRREGSDCSRWPRRSGSVPPPGDGIHHSTTTA